MLLLYLLLLYLPKCINANTEKVIFRAPELVHFPDSGPTLQHLRLYTLSPARPRLQTSVPLSFPDSLEGGGTETWILLDSLQAHARYEFRICWAATVYQISRNL